MLENISQLNKNEKHHENREKSFMFNFPLSFSIEIKSVKDKANKLQTIY